MPNNRKVALLFMLVLGGCSSTGQEYAGVNYGELTTPTGEHWKIAGGKDGTNVNFTAVTKPDGTKEVSLSADNYDATTVLAQANKAQQERIDRLTTLLLSTLTPTP